MCGIAGYWGTPSTEVLNSMNDTLTHRGPDDAGLAILGEVGFVHRRLSIVDLSPAGHQPMYNRDESVVLVYNGEIYNHMELREEFLQAYTFRGTSDTEVLLYLYEELGEAFLTKIQGMFAIALYDSKTGKLLLARDHMGKKPLYWTRQNDTLIFGSELKALRAHPLCPKKIDRTAVAQYLIYEYVPSPRTIYKDVHKLKAGTYLTYDGKEVKEYSYSNFTYKEGSHELTFSDAKDELTTLLKKAVTKRMIADVPVGVFLSGGLDSSTVAYLAQEGRAQQIKTFSIGFKDASFDESSYAREVAQVLKTDHHERMVGPHDLLGIIKEIPEVLDEPMADSSIVPTLLLSEFTSSEVKVALGGDGADELFWGYDTFFAHRIGEYYEQVPPFMHRGIQRVISALPVSHAYMSFDFKAKKFLSGFDTVKGRRNTYWLSAFTPKELKDILSDEVDESILFSSSDRAYTSTSTFWDGLTADYVEGYLTDDILVKTDRAGMAHSLEVRAPFLDVEVVNFALTISRHHKYRGRSGKYILKEAMKGHLPDHIITRSKKGFNIPVGSWIKYELKELFMSTILDGKLVSSGLFKREGLVILLESHMDGQFDHRKKLWTLFVLALWMEKWNE